MSEADERHCPVCGHDVLSWDVTCPGCDKVPWDTPAGRKEFRSRRFRHFVATTGPLVALVGVVAVVVVIGNMYLSRSVNIPREIEEQQRSIAYLADQLQQGSLPQAQRQEILDHLTNIMDKQPSVVGIMAAYVLVAHRDERAVPWLIEQLRTAHPKIAQASAKLLTAFSGQAAYAYGADYEAWTEWWQTYQKHSRNR